MPTFARHRSTIRNLVFLVPLCILILERISGTVLIIQTTGGGSNIAGLDVESVLPLLVDKKTTTTKNTNSERTERRRDEPYRPSSVTHATTGTLPRIPIERLTRSDETVFCGKNGLVAIADRHSAPSLSAEDRLIPRIVHQTSKTRCMTRNIAAITKYWLLQDTTSNSTTHEWSYYFHDDASVDALFQLDWPEFPHLHHVLACLAGSGTMRADLWRYLVLYEYGGIYADLDTKPNKFQSSMIRSDTDGFFVVEQYHIPSQWFMAMSPRHPLMYYTIQHALVNILQQLDTSKMSAPYVTGPHALLNGYSTFRNDVGAAVPRTVPNNKCIKAGEWVGTDQRSITVVGVGENEKEYVIREAIPRPQKIKEYQQMGMTHFLGETTATERGRICLSAIYHSQA